MSLFHQAAELQGLNARAALCVVVASSGSTPRKIGAKMIVIDEGDTDRIIGTIGGGAIEHLIRKKAVNAIRQKAPELVSTSLRNELGMCCGGEMTVFIEPIKRRPQFFCFGAGHIAQALCPLIAHIGFDVLVADERRPLLDQEAFSKARLRLDDTSNFAIKTMSFDDDTYVVVATHDHGLDQKIIENILAHPFKYAALVGSKRKALMTKKRLLAKGFLPNACERITCPAGIDIYARTPEEIAVSIAAQMISIKNAG